MNETTETRELTEQEMLDKVKSLKAENEELKAANNLLRKHFDDLRDRARSKYTQGLIDALVFALRCQSTCGDSIDPPDWSRP